MITKKEHLDYKEKKLESGKCKWKYFFVGFFGIFNTKSLDRKFCPHCCTEVLPEEYYKNPIYTIGCEKCRELIKK